MIYKRGTVYWYKFHWTIKGENGQPENYFIRKSSRASSIKKARVTEEEHRRALRLGHIHPTDPWPKVAPQAPKIPTLREFAAQFLSFAAVNTKPGTAKFYEVALSRVLKFSLLAEAPVTEITSELVSKYTRWRRDTSPNESVSTVNGELRTMRRAFNLAEEWGVLTRAPKISELSGARGRERVLTIPEEARYLAVASPTLHDAAILAADTGLRPNSELFRLEWRHVLLEGTETASCGLLHVPTGKTDAATRNVPLTPRAREVLLARKLALGETKYVFPGVGASGHLVTIQHAHEKAIHSAGLEPFEFYCWRHTFGTRCAESGMDRFSIASLMGHSSPRVAERYYIHVSETHVTSGFEKFVSDQERKRLDSFRQASNQVQ